MNKKTIIVLLGILAMLSLILSSCNGPVAGQATRRNSVQLITCPGGTICDGTPVTGTAGQVVCGTDLQNWKCTSTGWVGQKDKCLCPKICTDSDVDPALTGKDWLVKGTVVSDDYPKGIVDYCTNNFANNPKNITYLMEGRCSNNKYSANQKNCGEIVDNGKTNLYVCQDGACVNKNCEDLWNNYLPCQGSNVMANFTNSCTGKTVIKVVTDCSSFKGSFTGGTTICYFNNKFEGGCQEQYTCTSGQEIINCGDKLDNSGKSLGIVPFERLVCQNGIFTLDNKYYINNSGTCPSGQTCKYKYNNLTMMCSN